MAVITEGIMAVIGIMEVTTEGIAEDADGAEARAISTRDDHQCLRFADTCYGVQFHPEFDAEVMKGYVEARADLIAAEGLDADALAALRETTVLAPPGAPRSCTAHLPGARGRRDSSARRCRRARRTGRAAAGS